MAGPEMRATFAAEYAAVPAALRIRVLMTHPATGQGGQALYFIRTSP
jgi:hypothetical protein